MNTTNKEFDTEFEAIYTKIAALAWQFLENQRETIDKVYIYGALENNSYFFNWFFVGQEQVWNSRQIIRSMNISDDEGKSIIFDNLDTGISYLEQIENLFNKYHREPPTELKMIFDMARRDIDIDISYEKKYITPDISETDVFMSWMEEIRLNIKS